MLSARLFKPIARAAAPAFQQRSINSLAKASIIGRIGWIQEDIVNPGVMSYSVAVNQKIKGEETTSWYRVTVFGENQVRVASELLRKGNLVYVDGELRMESYTDKSGAPTKSVNIIQDTMRLLKLPPREAEEMPGDGSE